MNKIYYKSFFVSILATFFFIIQIACLDLLEEKSEEKSIDEWSQSIAQTLHLVKSKCYYPISFEKSLIKALDAFVSLDNYSHFLGPKDYKDLVKTTNGEFYGIGTVLAPKKKDEDYILVLDVAFDSPAEKKGIKRYDKIIAIDNVPVSKINMNQVVSKLRGEKRYSPVTLTILRDKKDTFKINLYRDIVKENHVKAYYFEKQKIIYCSLTLFCDQIFKQLADIIERYKHENIKGLILDLRDNAGGLLNSAVECASLVLPKDSLIVLTKNKNQVISDQFYTKSEPVIDNKTPIVIILNRFTASAAEILAGALKYYTAKSQSKDSDINPYIFTLGTKTYGKGSVQQVIPVGKDCALKITTDLYCLPDNNHIDQIGINPDFNVEQKFGPTKEVKMLNKLYGKEQSLTDSDKSQDAKTQKIIKKSIPDQKNKLIKLLKNDYQVQSAVNLINLLNLGIKIMPENLNNNAKALKFLKENFVTNDNLAITEIISF